MNRTNEIFRTFTASEQETADLGRKLAGTIAGRFSSGVLNRGTVIMLKGELGAGKTCFVKGAASHLLPSRHVTSPSYTIMNEYSSADLNLVHADLYRIESVQELEYTGLFSQPRDNTILMIEWPGLVRDEWKEYIIIEMEKRGERTRLLTFGAAGRMEISIVKELKKTHESSGN